MKTNKEKGLIINTHRLPAVKSEQLKLRERWAVSKEKAEADGRAWMVIVDTLIEEGVLKKRFR